MQHSSDVFNHASNMMWEVGGWEGRWGDRSYSHHKIKEWVFSLNILHKEREKWNHKGLWYTLNDSYSIELYPTHEGKCYPLVHMNHKSHNCKYCLRWWINMLSITITHRAVSIASSELWVLSLAIKYKKHHLDYHDGTSSAVYNDCSSGLFFLTSISNFSEFIIFVPLLLASCSFFWVTDECLKILRKSNPSLRSSFILSSEAPGQCPMITCSPKVQCK